MSVIKKNKSTLIFKKFKKRKMLKNNDFLKLKFGKIGFFLKNDCRFEFIYLALLKKYLKTLNFLKLKNRKFNKIWIFLNKNYPISTKSKNARMGKGKGSILRWSSRIPRYSCFLEFATLDFLKILKFKKKLNYKFTKQLYVINNSKVNFPKWINKTSSYFFLKKYNLI